MGSAERPSNIRPDDAEKSALPRNVTVPPATSAAHKGFIGGGAVGSYLRSEETTMKLIAMALFFVFLFSSSVALAHTVRHRSNVAAPSALLHPKYGDPNGTFNGYENRDVWGHWGAYYGPMIPAGAGGR